MRICRGIAPPCPYSILNYAAVLILAAALWAGDVAVSIHALSGLALLRLLTLCVAYAGWVLALGRCVLRRILSILLRLGRPLRAGTGATPWPAVAAGSAPPVAVASEHPECQEN